jgi:WD40 repeat protein
VTARLATGSEDQAVKLWHLPSGQELLALPVRQAGVRAIAFNPDGTRGRRDRFVA